MTESVPDQPASPKGDGWRVAENETEANMALNHPTTPADVQTDEAGDQPAVPEVETASTGIIPHDEVASLAYKYWEERGRPNGTPDEDWFRAEQALKEAGENACEG